MGTGETTQSLPLLLTGTVSVRGTPFTFRTDPAARLNDYRVAIRRWIHHRAVERIVFCENSGFDLGKLSDLQECAAGKSKQLELLSFDPPSYPSRRGKGYGEMQILEYALLHSQLISGSTPCVKVTGRYYVPNITRIVSASVSQDVDVMANLGLNLTYAHSAVFFATVSFIREYLLPLRDQIDDSHGTFMEHILARAIHRAMSDGRRWAPLPVVPDIRGVSGSTGTVCGRSLLTRSVQSCLQMGHVYFLQRWLG